MSAGMQWVDLADLQHRFTAPMLIEVDGDRSEMAGPLCEVVDVQTIAEETFTILHVPGGGLPCDTRRAMGIVYQE